MLLFHAFAAAGFGPAVEFLAKSFVPLRFWSHELALKIALE
jgi:hypothetical protein